MGNARITVEANFEHPIGERLRTAMNQAISEVQDSESGEPRMVVRAALIVALNNAWPSGISLSANQMHRLTSGIAAGGPYRARLA
jgi:hypothetical protein